MASMFGRVCVTVTLLMCALGGQALDLLKATSTSGSEYLSVTIYSRVSECLACDW